MRKHRRTCSVTIVCYKLCTSHASSYGQASLTIVIVSDTLSEYNDSSCVHTASTGFGNPDMHILNNG